MRTELVSACAGAFSWLLPSVCLRYGVALPSVWPRRRLCKLRQFNNFRSDYPLDSSWFWCPNRGVRETLRMCRFLVLRLGSFSSRTTLHRLESHRLAGVVCYPSNGLAYGSLVREAFADQFVSVHAGHLSSVPCLLRIAARKSSLKPHRKLLSDTAHTLWLNSRPPGRPVGNIWCACWGINHQSRMGQKGTDHVSKPRSSKFHAAVYD